jgi:recombination protein RecR
MGKFPEPIERLIAELSQLPGVGPKTAERYAFSLVKRSDEERQRLSEAILQAGHSLASCSLCRNWTTEDPCSICADPRRERDLICVVAAEPDLLAIEHTAEYHGLYHILGGMLSPADRITPEDLTIKELVERVRQMPPRELILALDPTVEGETTMLYLTRLVENLGVRVTRLARGLPIGSEVGYADQVTLSDAIRGRREVVQRMPESAPAKR